MPSLIDLRRRIRSVKSTQQITKAMKMISAARLRRAQDRVLAARPFVAMLNQILANVAAALEQGAESVSHPLLAVRPERRILLLILSGDRGLAGAFNANILKMAQRFIDEHRGAELSFDLIGRKGRDYIRRRYTGITGEYVGIIEKSRQEDAAAIARKIVDRYTAGEIDAVYLFVNEFKSVLAPRLSMTRVLPIEMPQAREPIDYIFEQPPAELLGTLLPRYVQVQVYRAMLESAAAEHAARMTAMDAATSNASEVIDKLTLYMNRVRQASITREIIEVVSGAAALE